MQPLSVTPPVQATGAPVQTGQQQQRGNLACLQNPGQVPGMALGLIHEQCNIEGVNVRAIADCSAAASVVTREFAYAIYKSGEAVWREGASDLLSLHGFGGIKVPLCEMYFAAKVKAFDTVFDQVFFVVDKAVHFALLGLPALMAARVQLLTITGRDVMPDFNKALTLDVSSHQRKAAETLNSLAELMRQEVNQLNPMIAWENLRLSEFGPQLNMLTELIPTNQPQNAELEVLEDEDEDHRPPGLEPIPAEEQATAPPVGTATSAEPAIIEGEATAAPSLLEYFATNALPLLGAWATTSIAAPFSPGQLASIHRTEINANIIAAGMSSISNDVHADVNWQETFQSDIQRNDTDSEGNSTDSDEPVGLFGLYPLEPCLVTARRCTLGAHTRTYVECCVV